MFCRSRQQPQEEQAFYDFWSMRCAEQPVLREKRPLNSSDPAQIIFTSGTTSRPKGVVVTHANMIFSGLYGDWEVSLRGSDRVLSTMPACHSNFQLAALMPVVTAGATIIIVEKFSAHRFWKQVRHYRATVIQLVAMMASYGNASRLTLKKRTIVYARRCTSSAFPTKRRKPLRNVLTLRS